MGRFAKIYFPVSILSGGAYGYHNIRYMESNRYVVDDSILAKLNCILVGAWLGPLKMPIVALREMIGVRTITTFSTENRKKDETFAAMANNARIAGIDMLSKKWKELKPPPVELQQGDKRNGTYEFPHSLVI